MVKAAVAAMALLVAAATMLVILAVCVYALDLVFETDITGWIKREIERSLK